MIVDGILWQHTNLGLEQMHGHVRPGTGHHDQNRLTKTEHATEFMRRVMAMWMFHMDVELMPHGQKARALNYMEASEPRQWAIMRAQDQE